VSDTDPGGLQGGGHGIACLAGQMNPAHHGSGAIKQDVHGGINPNPLGLGAKHTRIRHGHTVKLPGIKAPSSATCCPRQNLGLQQSAKSGANAVLACRASLISSPESGPAFLDVWTATGIELCTELRDDSFKTLARMFPRFGGSSSSPARMSRCSSFRAWLSGPRPSYPWDIGDDRMDVSRTVLTRS